MIWKYSLFLFCLCLCSQPVYSQYSFLNYATEDGLAQSHVSAIAEDQFGTLWIGTFGGGISVFDGLNFDRHNSASGLPNDYINVIKTGDSVVWIGTNYGLCIYDYKTFQHYLPTSGKPLKVLGLATWDTSLYLGTDLGLFAFNREDRSLKPVVLSEGPNMPVHTLLVRDGNLYIGNDAGLLSIPIADNSEFLDIDTLLRMPIDQMTLWNDRVMALSNSIGLYKYHIPEDSLILISETNNSNFNTLFPRDLSTLWVGTKPGLRYVNMSDTTLHTADGTLSSVEITTAFKDHWDNIWIGTLGQGLFKYLGNQFTHHFNIGSTINDPIHSIYIRDYDLFAGVGDQGVFQYRNDQWNILDSNLLGIVCSALTADHDGLLWISSEERLFTYDGDSLWNNSDVLNHPEGKITALKTDNNGTVWIGTEHHGIYSVEKFAPTEYSFIHFLQGEEWKETAIEDFHIDLLGRVWFSTSDGRIGLINKLGLDKIYHAEHGLPPLQIRSIAEDGLGRLILGTSGSGLYVAEIYVDSIHFTQVPNQVLKSLNVAGIALDNKGNIWMGSELGMERFQLNEQLEILDYTYFGIQQGYLSLEHSADVMELRRNGEMWFGTKAGLMEYEAREKENEFPPKIHFEKILLFNQELNISTSRIDTFDPDENGISFLFEGVHINRARDVQYQWKLNGLDTDWTLLSGSTFANYPQLPPGKYRFEVRACIPDYNCSETLTYSFIVQSFIWQKTWFYLILIPIVILLFLWLFRRRMKNLRIKNQKIQIENKLIDLEQKAMQLQMNPHFLFNALNSIQGTMSEGSIPEAKMQLSQFAKLMRSILTNSKAELLPLQKEIDLLEQYMKVEQFCRGNAFTYQIIMDEEIDPDEVYIPSMILQPFVENAIIHGFSKIDYLGELTIYFVIKGNILESTITDNGIGVQRSKKNKAQSVSHQSLGVQVTHDRLKMLSPNRKVDRIFIKDLSDSGGQGTQVKINIPLKY